MSAGEHRVKFMICEGCKLECDALSIVHGWQCCQVCSVLVTVTAGRLWFVKAQQAYVKELEKRRKFLDDFRNGRA